MADATNEKQSDRWLSEGLALALAPAIAYFLVFTYESAYCSTFGIPSHFVKPDITTVLTYATIIFGLYFILIPIFDMFADAISMSLVPIENVWVRLLVLFLPLLMFFILMLTIYIKQWKTLIPITLIFIGVFVADILATWFFRDKSKPFAQQLDTGIGLFLRPGTPIYVVRSRFGARIATIILLVFIGVIVSRSLGNAAALNQKAFLIPSTHPKTVVLRQYWTLAKTCGSNPRF